MVRSATDKVTVRSVNAPGYTGRLDRTKYESTKKALLRVLPSKLPGLTYAEMVAAVQPLMPKALFPDVGKVMWWVKGVQLDLETKKILVRDKAAKPLRWRKTA